MRPRDRSREAIIVGTDFSRCADIAFDRALQIARARAAALHVVHAHPRLPRALVDMIRGRDEVAERKALAALLRRARAAKVAAHAHNVQGTATGVLRAKARDLHASLVVVGARGRTVPDAFIGSTAERVAATARVPALLVRSAHHGYREVLIAADEESDLTLMRKAAETTAPGVEISILHAYQDPFEPTLLLHGVPAPQVAKYRKETRQHARESMLTRLADAGFDPSQLVLRHGDARRVLLREDQHRRHTLFVIDRGESELEHVLLGSVTRLLVAHASSDVLIT